jgi:hypothetical protein
MQSLGLDIPEEFRISAQYVLTKQFNELFTDSRGFIDSDIIQQASDINFEAKRIGISIDKTPTAKIFSKKIAQNVGRLAYALDIQQVDATLELLDCIEKLEINVDIAEAQNDFFAKVVSNIEEIIQNMTCSADRELVSMLFAVGENLNINMEYYKQMFSRALVGKDIPS